MTLYRRLLLCVLAGCVSTAKGFVSRRASAGRLEAMSNCRVRSRIQTQIYNQNSEYTPTVESPIQQTGCRVQVFGVGGGGGNAVNRIVRENEALPGVQLWAVNTDAQALAANLAPHKLNIGKVASRGLGAGGVPEAGRRAAEENRIEIKRATSGADLVFVTAGMGGGTGSGAASVVADCAKENGALTIGVVTKPFAFEGRKRMKQAVESINELKNKVDTLVVISNDRLLKVAPPGMTLSDSFLMADEMLQQGVTGVSDIILRHGVVNVDFADVRTIMANAGTALVGVGRASGPNRAEDAALAALNSPLLDFPVARAKGLIFNVVGGKDLSLQEVNNVAATIYDKMESDANIIFGAQIDDAITNSEIKVTVIATGFPTDYFLGGEEQLSIDATLPTSIGDKLMKKRSISAPISSASNRARKLLRSFNGALKSSASGGKTEAP